MLITPLFIVIHRKGSSSDAGVLKRTNDNLNSLESLAKEVQSLLKACPSDPFLFSVYANPSSAICNLKIRQQKMKHNLELTVSTKTNQSYILSDEYLAKANILSPFNRTDGNEANAIPIKKITSSPYMATPTKLPPRFINRKSGYNRIRNREKTLKNPPILVNAEPSENMSPSSIAELLSKTSQRKPHSLDELLIATNYEKEGHFDNNSNGKKYVTNHLSTNLLS